MSVFEHNYRSRIYNPGQHPLKHTLDDFGYTNNAMPNVTTLQSALDWLFTVLYPRTKDPVATPADLPSVGNTLLDYRVVTDDGDGKAASYRWEQREGDSAAKWYKIYDMDWGEGSILANFLDKTQDLYVYKYGIDDLDSSGTALAGTNAGQHIYGGQSANTNLTLHANSGDGTGAQTGYVQTTDHFRPTSSNALDLGTSSNKFRTGYFGTSVLAGTTTISGGSYADSSGAVSFHALNLSTTGSFSANSVASTTSVSGASVSATGDSSAATFTGPILQGGASAGGTLTLKSTTNGTKGNILFGTSGYDEVNNRLGLGTSSPSYALDVQNGRIDVGNLSNNDTFLSARVGSAEISFSQFAGIRLDVNMSDGAAIFQVFDDGAGTSSTYLLARHSRHLILGVDGTSTTKTVAAQACLGQTADIFQIQANGGSILAKFDINGNFTTTGYAIADRVQLSGTTISTLGSPRTLFLAPGGGGQIEFDATFYPGTDATYDLGKTAARVQNLYLSGAIGDGTTTIASSVLQSLRDINVGVGTNYTIFWNGTKWVASAPDSEIDHTTLSNLTSGDAGHTQFALLAGRSGGQTLNGDTAASGNLNLESTAHATKGKILAKSVLAAFTDASFSVTWSGTDLGGSSNRWRHVYTAGEYFGLRLENRSSDDTSAASAIGRLWWNTTSGYVALDNGSTVQRVSLFRYQTDTSWDGSTTTKNVTVSGIDAQQALWQLKDNTNNYEIMQVKIEATSTTNIRITTNVALPAGSYRLTGIQ